MEAGDSEKNDNETETKMTRYEPAEVKTMRYELAEAKLELEMMSKAFLHCIRHRNTLQKHLDDMSHGPRPDVGETKTTDQLFDFHPPYWVAFTGPYDDSCFATLELRNLSYRQDAYFRIKTTHPKAFRVCPTTGVISPGQTKLIVIELADPNDIEELKQSKFLVQSAGVPFSFSTQDPQDIWRELSIRGQFLYKKLPVVFQPPLDDSTPAGDD